MYIKENQAPKPALVSFVILLFMLVALVIPSHECQTGTPTIQHLSLRAPGTTLFRA